MSIIHPFIVIDDARLDTIIGNDFLYGRVTIHESVQISFKCPTGKHSRKIPILYNLSSHRVAAISTIRLLPFQTLVVKADLLQPTDDPHFHWPYANNKPIIISPSSQCAHNAQITDTVSMADLSHRVPILLSNPTNSVQEISANTILATAEYVQSATLDTTDHALVVHNKETVDEILNGSTQGMLPLPGGIIPQEQDNNSYINDFSSLSLPHLKENETKQLRTLLDEFSDIFAKHDLDCGKTDFLSHSIDTGDAHPVYEKYRPMPPALVPEINRQINKLLEAGIIEPAPRSPWAANLVFVKKKSGEIRCCTDLRRVNKLTKNRVQWAIPHVEESYSKLVNSKYITMLDFTSAYFAIPLADESSKNRTSFYANGKLYRYTRSPFGQCDIPAVFNRFVSILLHGCEDFTFGFFDDVSIFSATFAEHLQHLRAVFIRIRESGMRLKHKKCHYALTQAQPIPFLGSVIFNNQLHPDPNKINAIKDLQAPKTKKQLQKFLGMASYLRKHIKHFATIASPLHELTAGTPNNKKDFKLEWPDKAQTSFELIKEALVSAPALALPDFSQKFIVTSDASALGLGATLSQVNKAGVEQILAYASRRLTPNERTHTTTPEQELLAVLFAISTWHYYLSGKPFIMRVDAQALVFCQIFKNTNSRLYKSSLLLQELDFHIEHMKSVETNAMCIADYLSRSFECNKTVNHSYSDLRKKLLNQVQAPDNMPQRISYEDFQLLCHPQVQSFHEQLKTSKHQPKVASLHDQPLPGEFDEVTNSPITCPSHDLMLDHSAEAQVLLTSLTDSLFSLDSFAQLQRDDDNLSVIIQQIADKDPRILSERYFLKRHVLMLGASKR